MRVVRFLHRVFSWSVIGPVVVLLLAVLLAVSVAGAFVAAHDAIGTRDKTAAAAARRIDHLLHRIDTLQAQLRNTSTRDAQERGRLEDAIRALVTQLRQAHLEPVTTGQPSSPRPSSNPSPSRTASPRPTPKPSRAPHPSPSPSPTCIKVNPIHKTVCVAAHLT